MSLDHTYWAQYLLHAADSRTECEAIVPQIGSLSIDEAYDIQDALVALRIARGEKIIGAKLGLTSIAKQQQMGVSEPCYGWIFDSGLLSTDHVPLELLIHPRGEPEYVFTMAQDVSGSSVSAHDILDATAHVGGGIEVIDSRYEKFKFTLPDVIADNTSASMMRIGGGIGSRDADLTTVGCTFEVDGAVAATATGAALLGDPAGCMAMLVAHLHKRGRKLEAGWVVLAGAATDAQPLHAGTSISARYSAFPSVRIHGS